MRTHFTSLIFYAVIIAVLFSCTSDENSLSRNGIMKRSVQTFYNNNGEVISRVIKTYENNKVLVDSAFWTNAGLVAVTDYSYQDNKVVRIYEDYLYANLTITKNITYDQLGRITRITTEESNGTLEYTYDETKIISNKVTDGGGEQKTYILDLEENIIIETGFLIRIEAIYNEDNLVITKTRNPREFNQEPIDYTYDQTRFPPDDFKFFRENEFGDYKNNGVLFDDTLNNIAAVSEITNRVFIVSEYRGGRNVEIERNFNDKGYPTTKEMSIDGNLFSLTEYFYN